MKGAILIVLVTVFAVIAAGTVYQRVVREQSRATIAEACIKEGKRYHETMFRRRPVCR